MQEKTLRELCEACGVSRRAVQGYERLGLVAPTGKTNRGYLLYDAQAEERICKIHRLQQFGFSLKEIQALVGKTTPELRDILAQRRLELKQQYATLDTLLEQIESMIETLQ